MKKRKLFKILLIVFVVILIIIIGLKIFLLVRLKDDYEYLNIGKNITIKNDELFSVNISNNIDKKTAYYGITDDKNYFIATKYLPDNLTEKKVTFRGEVIYSDKNNEDYISFKREFSSVDALKYIFGLSDDINGYIAGLNKYVNNYKVIKKELPNIKNDYYLLNLLKQNNFKININIFTPLANMYLFNGYLMPTYIEFMDRSISPINYLIDDQEVIIGSNEDYTFYEVIIPIDDENNYIISIDNYNKSMSFEDIQKVLNNIVLEKK